MTNAQKRVLKEIRKVWDWQKQMKPLTTSDVGSGKQLLDNAMLMRCDNWIQACLMRQTEIFSANKALYIIARNVGRHAMLKFPYDCSVSQRSKNIHKNLESRELHIWWNT